QAPNIRKAPNLKLQYDGTAAEFGIWSLGFFWCLVFGIWCFFVDIFQNQDHPRPMKRKSVIPMLGLLAAFALVAQDSSKKTDANKPDISSSRANVTADQVIEKYVAAIGGKEAYQKLRSRAIKATRQDTAGNPPDKAELYAK